MNRNKKRGAHLDRRTIILISVGAALAIIIIVAAILLMTRSGGGGKYEEHYSAAMEYYISGDFDSAVEEAQKAYDADATEDAAVLLARCYDQHLRHLRPRDLARQELRLPGRGPAGLPQGRG